MIVAMDISKLTSDLEIPSNKRELFVLLLGGSREPPFFMRKPARSKGVCVSLLDDHFLDLGDQLSPPPYSAIGYLRLRFERTNHNAKIEQNSITCES